MSRMLAYSSNIHDRACLSLASQRSTGHHTRPVAYCDSGDQALILLVNGDMSRIAVCVIRALASSLYQSFTYARILYIVRRRARLRAVGSGTTPGAPWY